jgi:hypothetical protein
VELSLLFDLFRHSRRAVQSVEDEITTRLQVLLQTAWIAAVVGVSTFGESWARRSLSGPSLSHVYCLFEAQLLQTYGVEDLSSPGW